MIGNDGKIDLKERKGILGGIDKRRGGGEEKGRLGRWEDGKSIGREEEQNIGGRV